MKTLQAKKWRRINRYTCRGCGKKRYTLKYSRAVAGFCRKCLKATVPENQTSLFDNDQQT